MRHGKKFNHLGRTKSHREAMLSNMAVSLIMHKRIKTTVAKAKALRGFVEPLITKSKDDSTHSRRVIFSYLQNKDAVTELFREVSVKIGERPGGYTRILKTGTRLGDNADMCIIELVDYNENMLSSTQETKSKTTRRSRRGGTKKPVDVSPVEEQTTVETPEAITSTEDVVADVVDEVAVEDSETKDVTSASEEKIPEEKKDAPEEGDVKE